MPYDGLDTWGPTWGPALATLGAILCLAWLPDKPATGGARWARVAAACLTAGLTFRYVIWRVQAVPEARSFLQYTWVVAFLSVEMLNALNGLLNLLFMSRTLDRSSEADAKMHSPLHTAPTDVLIATYNEPRDVLERTIIGAMDIDHPDLRVWVLDDGARDWVRDLAEALGTFYIRRVKGKHAKAGNVNNGLRQLLTVGRPPEFILLLDADFIASRQILRRTLGFFEAEDVGIVQTPQHFFNPDPVQINLACSNIWPDEQRFFFNVMLPCMDAWGAAFCCGTSAVLRVEALQDIGGMATETVTEDMLTSFKMEEFGWRTIFLNERLSLGLAPEGLGEYVTQRSRWCLGAVQQLHTRWSWFGRGRLRTITRLACLSGSLYWIVSFLFRLMMLAGPAVYWWTGTSVIVATNADILYWLVPAVLSSILFMSVYSRNLIIPVMSDITQLVSAVAVIGNVATGLFRPRGQSFKVTPKGVSRDHIVLQWGLIWPFLIIAAATLSGLAINVSASSSLVGGSGYGVNVFWSLFNVVLVSLVCLACIELPRRRTDERFLSNEPGVVIWPNEAVTECVVRDISSGGARLSAPAGADPANLWDTVHAVGHLSLDEGRLKVPFHLLRCQENELIVQFDTTLQVRRALIGRLFGGDYARELERVTMHRVLGMLVNRLLR
ncbi:MAG TPA: glycosyltransferase [Rhodopila sp.]